MSSLQSGGSITLRFDNGKFIYLLQKDALLRGRTAKTGVGAGRRGLGAGRKGVGAGRRGLGAGRRGLGAGRRGMGGKNSLGRWENYSF